MGLGLGTNLKFYTSVGKGLKLKVRKFWGLIPTFVEVTEEKLVGEGDFGPPIWTRLKKEVYKYFTKVLKNVYVRYCTYIDFGIENNDKDPKFKAGDHVRISKNES